GFGNDIYAEAFKVNSQDAYGAGCDNLLHSLPFDHHSRWGHTFTTLHGGHHVAKNVSVRFSSRGPFSRIVASYDRPIRSNRVSTEHKKRGMAVLHGGSEGYAVLTFGSDQRVELQGSRSRLAVQNG